MHYIKGLFDTYEILEANNLIGHYDENGLGIFPKYHNMKGFKKGESVYKIKLSSQHNNYLIEDISPTDTKSKIFLVFPTTIESNGRDGETDVPHGVSEELKYMSLAFAKGNNYTTYLTQLNEWLTFTGGMVWLDVVYKFLNTYDVYNILTIQYPESKIDGKTFVTFEVDDVDISNSQDLQNSWIEFLESKYTQGYGNFYYGQDDLTGDEGIVPSKYSRFSGTARMLSKSNNDEYHRGRFIEKGGLHDVISVTHLTSQKAYNLLTYLLNAKGKNSNWLGADTTLVMWMDGTEIKPEVTIDDGLDDLWLDDSDDINITDNVLQDYLSRTLGTQNNQININEGYNVYLLVIVKTNNGRVAVKKYQKLTEQGYQDVINYWYATTSWGKYYTDSTQVSLNLKQLVITLFGDERESGKYYNIEVNQGFEGKMVRLIEELVDTKMNQGRLPIKFYKKAMQNVRQRNRYKNTWDKILTASLSMYKKYMWDYKKQFTGVDVDLNNQSSSYLFGRLMAVYEQIESTAIYYKGSEKRQTFVEKNWSSIINRPLHMWNRMQIKAQPYLNQLLRKQPGVYHKYQNLLNDIGSQLDANGDFGSVGKKSLGDDFILGYYHQQKALRNNNNTNNNQEEDTNE